MVQPGKLFLMLPDTRSAPRGFAPWLAIGQVVGVSGGEVYFVLYPRARDAANATYGRIGIESFGSYFTIDPRRYREDKWFPETLTRFKSGLPLNYSNPALSEADYKPYPAGWDMAPLFSKPRP